MLKYARKAVLWTFGQTMPDRAADWFEKVILEPRSMGRGGGGEVVPFPDGARTIRVPYGQGWIVAREWESGSSANSGNAVTPTTPAVLLMHGWGSSSSRMAGFVQPLLDAGYRVIVYDAPAHGESSGTRTNIVDCSGAVLQIGRHVGPLHAVVAHSFGATVAAAAATKFGLGAGRYVFIGAPKSMFRQTIAVGELIGLPRHVGERMASRFAQRLGIDWNELETDRMVAQLEAPLLVVHDKEDAVVPYAHGVAVADASRFSRLITTRGHGHRRLLTDPEVHRAVVDFLVAPAEDVMVERLRAG